MWSPMNIPCELPHTISQPTHSQVAAAAVTAPRLFRDLWKLGVLIIRQIESMKPMFPSRSDLTIKNGGAFMAHPEMGIKVCRSNPKPGFW